MVFAITEDEYYQYKSPHYVRVRIPQSRRSKPVPFMLPDSEESDYTEDEIYTIPTRYIPKQEVRYLKDNTLHASEAKNRENMLVHDMQKLLKKYGLNMFPEQRPASSKFLTKPEADKSNYMLPLIYIDSRITNINFGNMTNIVQPTIDTYSRDIIKSIFSLNNQTQTSSRSFNTHSERSLMNQSFQNDISMSSLDQNEQDLNDRIGLGEPSKPRISDSSQKEIHEEVPQKPENMGVDQKYQIGRPIDKQEQKHEQLLNSSNLNDSIHLETNSEITMSSNRGKSKKQMARKQQINVSKNKQEEPDKKISNSSNHFHKYIEKAAIYSGNAITNKNQNERTPTEKSINLARDMKSQINETGDGQDKDNIKVVDLLINDHKTTLINKFNITTDKQKQINDNINTVYKESDHKQESSEFKNSINQQNITIESEKKNISIVIPNYDKQNQSDDKIIDKPMNMTLVVNVQELVDDQNSKDQSYSVYFDITTDAKLKHGAAYDNVQPLYDQISKSKATENTTYKGSKSIDKTLKMVRNKENNNEVTVYSKESIHVPKDEHISKLMNSINYHQTTVANDVENIKLMEDASYAEQNEKKYEILENPTTIALDMQKQIDQQMDNKEPKSNGNITKDPEKFSELMNSTKQDAYNKTEHFFKDWLAGQRKTFKPLDSKISNMKLNSLKEDKIYIRSSATHSIEVNQEDIDLTQNIEEEFHQNVTEIPIIENEYDKLLSLANDKKKSLNTNTINYIEFIGTGDGLIQEIMPHSDRPVDSSRRGKTLAAGSEGITEKSSISYLKYNNSFAKLCVDIKNGLNRVIEEPLDERRENNLITANILSNKEENVECNKESKLLIILIYF